MSVASKLEELRADVTNARAAITAKGGVITIGGGSSQLAADIGTISSGEPYLGPYTVTPNASTQTLQTTGKLCSDSITVNPIPSNYGLITYNGFELTVS